MKRCCTCKKEKEISEFSKNRANKDGLQKNCKKCKSITAKEWKERNPEYGKNHYRNNLARYSSNSKARRELKREEILAYNREYKKNNKHKVNSYGASRRAGIRKATPVWLTNNDKKIIESMYAVAEMLTILTFGNRYHVDHIIPLKGRNVCGLHVPNNLRVIRAEENLSKGNKYE